MAPPKKKSASPASTKPRVSALGRAAAAADPAGDKQPMFPEEARTHRVVFHGIEECEQVAGRDPWVRCNFSNDELGEVVGLFCVSSKSLAATGPRVKSLAMATLGYTDKDEYDAFDPNGSFVDALLGIDNGDSPKGFDKTYAEIAAEYVGTVEIDVAVTLGNEAPDGTRYRNLSFRPVDAEEEEEEEEEASPPAKAASVGPKKSGSARIARGRNA